MSDSLLPGRRRTAVLAAALTAGTPGLVAIGSLGHNDGFAFAVGTILLAVVLRVARFGPTRGRLIATLVLAAAAVLVRSSLVPLVPLAAIVWLVRSWSSSPRRSLATAALVSLVPAATGGWFYLRNIQLYGSFSGSGHLQEKFGREPVASTFELLRQPMFLVGCWQDLWGSFKSNAALGSGRSLVGTTGADLGSRLVIGGSLAVASAAGWLRSLVSRRWHASSDWFTWLVALSWVAVCIVGIASFVGGGGSPHPRYLLPGHGVVVVAMAGGLWALPGRRLVVPGAVLGVVAVDLLLFTRLSAASTEQPFPTRFSQPGSSTVVVLVALAAGLAAAAVAVRSWCEVDEGTAMVRPVVRG